MSINLGRKIEYSEVQDLIKDLHVEHPEREWYPEERIAQFQHLEWFEATISLELIGEIVWGDYHYHESGKTDLVEPTDNMRKAVENFPALDPATSIPNCDCVEKVTGIQALIAERGAVKPLVLVWHERENRLEHIDGFHRIVAWMLNPPTDKMRAVIARQP